MSARNQFVWKIFLDTKFGARSTEFQKEDLHIMMLDGDMRAKLDELLPEPGVPYQKNSANKFLGNPFKSIWIEFLPHKDTGAAPQLYSSQNYEEGITPINGEHITSNDKFSFHVMAGAISQMEWPGYTHRYFLTYVAQKCPLGCDGAHEVNPENVTWYGKWLEDGEHVFYETLFSLMGDKTIAVGEEKSKIKYRTGTGTDRSQRKIKRIVHVGLKKNKMPPTMGVSREVDWSHRWEVMGHWRKVSGIGKDDLDNYCVNGKTWVKPHVRGPDDMEVVKKLRLVKGEK